MGDKDCMDLSEMPGHNADSYGYHGDDGMRSVRVGRVSVLCEG